jgi:hypothetical protein
LTWLIGIFNSLLAELYLVYHICRKHVIVLLNFMYGSAIITFILLQLVDIHSALKCKHYALN